MENLIMVNNSNRRLNFNNYQSSGRRATQGNMPVGTLNPLNIRTITNTINIDTRFRNNYETTSPSNVSINLENIQKRVVALKVIDIELPLSFYTNSRSRNNTTFFIKKINNLDSNNNKQAWLVTLPDGNYELDWLNENKGEKLILSINKALNNSKSGYLTKDDIFIEDSIENQISLDNSIIFNVDIASGKSLFKGGENLINGINTVDIIFNVDNKIIKNPSIIEKQQFLGWDLGFRNTNYRINLTSDTLISEGICITSGPRYGFISLNDKQTKTTSNFVSAYNSSLLEKHIISKINLSAAMDDVCCFKSSSKLNCYEPFNQIREYFGPVDIKNLEIKLLDEYGRIIDLNNMDWSLTLVFETLYD